MCLDSWPHSCELQLGWKPRRRRTDRRKGTVIGKCGYRVLEDLTVFCQIEVGRTGQLGIAFLVNPLGKEIRKRVLKVSVYHVKACLLSA